MSPQDRQGLDAWTLRLLGMAVEACDDVWVSRRQSEFSAMTPGRGLFHGPTLADALLALFESIGVEPPRLASAERVRESMREVWGWWLDDLPGALPALRDLAAREPMTALAVLGLVREEATDDA